MSQSVMQENWLAVFKVKVKARAYVIKTWLYDLLYLLNAGPLAAKLGLIIQHHKPEHSVQKLDYCIQGQGQNAGDCLSEWYLLNFYYFCPFLFLPFFFLDTFLISGIDKSMEWFTIPTCPSLKCFFNNGNAEGTISSEIYVWSLCMFVCLFL